jgi:hypothetical protein
MRRKPRPSGKFIDLRTAEAEYAISYHKIYAWVTQGLIPRLDSDAVGHAVLIRRADLEKFLDDHMTTGVRR